MTLFGTLVALAIGVMAVIVILCVLWELEP